MEARRKQNGSKSEAKQKQSKSKTEANVNVNVNVNDNVNVNNNKYNKPTLEEIKKYIEEKKLNVNAKQFYDYFETGNWIDAKGNKVKNWKQKILTWNKFNSGSMPDKKEFEAINEDLVSLYEN